MVNYTSLFENLIINDVKHWRTLDVIEQNEIKEDEGWCGVIHLHEIKWVRKSTDYEIDSATVDMYLGPFKETNEVAKERTDHRAMMEELKFWENFEALKNRACDEEGSRRWCFRKEKESQLFFGFTRKNNVWSDTSCTLNS